MWLPETAAELETLDVLACQGIQFTIQAPWQAEQEGVDVTRPYLVRLPEGRQITVFFYHRELSGRISFDAGATTNADRFAEVYLQAEFQAEKQRRGEPQIILLASDGELYGHHQYLRDHFLARLVDGASSSFQIQPTYPALWLKDHPAREEMRIHERTSWSCHHGVTRWMGKCDCTPGEANWKAQLRYSLERAAGEIDRIYAQAAQAFVPDPWELRREYIRVILGEMSVDRLIEDLAGKALTRSQVLRMGRLLEAQRERQRMFTSCGWFFEDFDRIEPRNNVAYAAQAVFLTRLATGVDLEPFVGEDLERVISERTGVSAGQVFERRLRRAEGVKDRKLGFA
jgi:alpha-amylase/alpha-mannosidase (GH57 family)